MTANDKQVGGAHYKKPIQHWDLVIANNIPYLEAQIIKYVMRWREKNGLEDLQKAQHFLEKLMETVTPDPRSGLDDLTKAERRTYDEAFKRAAVYNESFKKVTVKPTGWIGFTWEGGNKVYDEYTCGRCKEQFRVPCFPILSPYDVHVCSNLKSTEDPSSRYVDQ